MSIAPSSHPYLRYQQAGVHPNANSSSPAQLHALPTGFSNQQSPPTLGQHQHHQQHHQHQRTHASFFHTPFDQHHAALLHSGNGYSDPTTHSFPTMLGPSSFISTAPSSALIGAASGNVGVTGVGVGPSSNLPGQHPNSSFASPTPFHAPMFPYSNPSAINNSSWIKMDDQMDDPSFYHRAYRSKPHPPSDEIIHLPPLSSSLPLTSFYHATHSSPTSFKDSTPPNRSRPQRTNAKKNGRQSPKSKSTSNLPPIDSFQSDVHFTAAKPRQRRPSTKKRNEQHFSSDENEDGEKSPSGGASHNASLVTSSDSITNNMDIQAATAAAKSAIQKTFTNAFVKIRGQRHAVLSLKHIGNLLSLEHDPTEHQVKDFNIIPTPVIKLSANTDPKTCDFVAAFLYCDESMNIEDSIFLAALNAKLVSNNELAFINLRVTKDMLKGRTKGFSFVIGFTYISDGQEIETIYTTPFWLFSNVNQEGFPKSERDSYLRPQWRDASGTFTAKRKR
jgi:hypothetical protein